MKYIIKVDLTYLLKNYFECNHYIRGLHYISIGQRWSRAYTQWLLDFWVGVVPFGWGDLSRLPGGGGPS